MSTTSTSRAYLEKINQNYPVAGQDNDSQGFRDNFKNIKDALSETDISLENLKLSAVAVTNTSTDFNFNSIERVTIKNRAYTVVDRTTSNLYSSSSPVNYTEGSYQKILLPSGNQTINIINWPTGNKSGRLTLDIQSSGSGTVNFAATGSGQFFKFGNSKFPVPIINGVKYVFEIWNVGFDLYVEALTTSDSSTSSSYVQIKNNIYTVNSVDETVVTNNGKRGTVALVPNKVITTVTNDLVDSPTSPGSANLPVSSATGIEAGAKIVSTITNNVFTVVSLNTNSVTLTPVFNTDPNPEFPNGSSVYFVNPQFTDHPTIATLISEEPTVTTGGPRDLKGQIFANTNTLWVAYDDYTGSQNWFKINSGSASSLGTNESVLNNSTGTAATTAFVHSVLPYGSIIMWYGNVGNIPTGWALCNGSNGTPDLRDKFVVGAGSTYTAGVTGGSADAIVVTHTHSATASGTQSTAHTHGISDPGHTHRLPTDVTGGTDTQSLYGTPNADEGFDISSESATTGITINSAGPDVNFSNASVTVTAAGSAGTGANLPPYYALCYIMKTSGGA